MKGKFLKRIMSAALGTITVAATIMGTVPMTAFAAGGYSVGAELEWDYTLTDNMTYWGEGNQKNYQEADGSADGDYLVESMEWTNIKNGEGKIRVAGANTEPSIALYVFTSCFHGVSTLSRPEVLTKDIESLANAYDRVDVIAIDGPEEWEELGEGYEGLYGGIHEVKSFTATNAYTAENWVTNEVKRWTGGHFTGNVSAAIRKYMFGAVDAEIDPDNVINRPSAIYVSADMHYLTNAEEAGTYGEESRLAEYASPEMFEYLAKYYRGETQRYFSSSQTGKDDAEKTVLVKRRSTYDADYMRIVAGVFNPELYSVGDKMLARWSGEAPDTDTTAFPMTDGKFASDYNYKDDMLSAGLRLPDKQISVQKTVSNDFQILGVTAKTTSGLKANISVKGQTITATAASFLPGDEISMEITVKLKNGLSKLYTKASDSGDGAKLLDGDIAIKQIDSAKFMPLTRDVSVSMTWDDDENRDGIRPDDTDIVLSGSEGSSFSYNMKNNEMQIKGLLDYCGGKKVTYSVSEKSISGYSVNVIADSANSSFAVTNTHTPGRITVKVTKTWEDDDNRNGLRPDSIFVTLKGSDGSSYDAELNAKNSWKYEFSNLYSYVDGKEITYSLAEKSVEGYTTKMTEADGSYTLVNTYINQAPKITKIAVTGKNSAAQEKTSDQTAVTEIHVYATDDTTSATSMYYKLQRLDTASQSYIDIAGFSDYKQCCTSESLGGIFSITGAQGNGAYKIWVKDADNNYTINTYTINTYTTNYGRTIAKGQSVDGTDATEEQSQSTVASKKNTVKSKKTSSGNDTDTVKTSEGDNSLDTSTWADISADSSEDVMHLVKLQNIKDSVTPAAEGSLKADAETVTKDDTTSNTSNSFSLYAVLATASATGAFRVLKKKKRL